MKGAPQMFRLLGGGILSPPQLRLEGPHVYLRPPQPRDWAEWAALRGDSRAFLEPWEPIWPPDSLHRSAFGRRIRRAAQEWRDDEGYGFLMFLQSDDRLVGGITLSNIRRGASQAATLGYWVGERHARRGYTSEAARLLTAFAFGQLGLHRIEAACLPQNAASIALLERVGFTREGIARGYLQIAGRWQDHFLYARLRDDTG